jgi:sulfopropanediol 3-dehydrogenase
MKVMKQGQQRLFETDAETAAVVTRMLVDLERNGMDAVRQYSRKFDDWEPPSFLLSEAQIREAIARVPEQGIRDTDFCQGNVRKFAEEQFKTMLPLEVEIRPGVILGHKHIPVNAVGSYVPGGRYPMFGSAQMSIIPARVAGVKRIAACTPPVKGQGYYPATINAIKKAGADAIYILGGVPALALVACDLLGQAEHDPNSGVCLICLSEDFALRAIKELEKQLAVLPTREIASLSWRDQGIVYVASDPEEAIRLSDNYAPEHLELHVRDVDFYFPRLTNYGSLFIGEETTVAYGDKTIGTNHILPTSRAARYTGGLWVGKFLKTCTYQRMTPEASVEVGEVTERQCILEHMLAHGITARVRVERYGALAPRGKSK